MRISYLKRHRGDFSALFVGQKALLSSVEMTGRIIEARSYKFPVKLIIPAAVRRRGVICKVIIQF